MLCEYGCENEAKYQIGKKKKWCCSKSYNKCPSKRKMSAKGRKYIPKTIDDGSICSFGCGEVAHYKHKNGTVSCKKILQKCKGNRNKTSITKLSSDGPAFYKGRNICDYGCNDTALYIFENGKICCSANAGKCKGVLNDKWDNFEKKYGSRNPMHVERFLEKQNINRNETLLKKYGVNNPIHIDGMKEKLEKIFLERYNVKSPLELANKKAIEQNRWLDLLGINEECRESRIDLNDGIKSGWIIADAFEKNKNTIYEFWGDLWHGNLNVFEPDKINPFNNKTMLELFEETEEKRLRIKRAGYILIEIWENDWIKQRNKGEINGKNNAT